MRTKNRWLVVAIIAALVSLGMIAAACDDDDDDTGPAATTQPDAAEPTDEPSTEATTVDVGLTEFTVSPSLASVPAGSVSFSVSNSGVTPHNLRVIRTDLAADALPVDNTTLAVDEDQVEVVASTSDLDADGTEDVTADLEAGSYVLICNVPTHYDSGMTVAFTVE